MYQRATKMELFLFSLVVIFLSGAPGSLYVKLFNYAPPTPEVLLSIPVLLLMLLNMLLRVRATLTGVIACWTWVAIALLAVISYTWSVSPADTIREGIVMLIVVTYLGMVAGIANWEDIIKCIWRSCLLLIFISFILYVGIPKLGKMQEVYEGALVGPWFEKNATGQFFLWAGLTNLAYLAIKPKRILVAGFFILVCFIGLILTKSTTALLAYLVVIALFMLVGVLRRNALISVPATLLIIAAMVPLFLYTDGDASGLLEGLGKSGTLTGRIPIWQAIIDYSLHDRPLLGHGYSAYWADQYAFGSRALVYDELDFTVHHSHNALIEARLDLGWIGAALLAAALLQTILMSLIRLRSSNGAYFAIPFCVAVIMVGAVETSPAGVRNLSGFLFVLTLAKMTLNPSRSDRLSGFWHYMKKLAAGRKNLVSSPAFSPAYPVARADIV